MEGSGRENQEGGDKKKILKSKQKIAVYSCTCQGDIITDTAKI